MTEAQRAARRAILIALKAIKKEADASWRQGEDEFVAHFHLSCIKNSMTTFQGRPAHMSEDSRIYAYGRSTVPRPHHPSLETK